MKKQIISFIAGAAVAIVCSKIYAEERCFGDVLRRKPCNGPEPEDVPEMPEQMSLGLEDDPELIVEDILDDIDADELEQEMREEFEDEHSEEAHV